jgi:hypothetical protein
MLHEVLSKVEEQSGFVWFYKAVKKAGTVCKNRDKPINFIVRVRLRLFLKISSPV